MYHHNRHRATPWRIASVSVALATVLSGCSDFIPTRPDAVPVRSPGAQQRQGPSRTDTPWRRMSDAELSAKIAEANGKVFIGFKDPTAAAGVEEFGRVIASPASVAAGKAHVRALGIQITHEYILVPAVVAVMPASLLPQLRANHLVEYVEPIFPGVRHSQTTTWNVQRVRAPEAWTSSTGSGAKLLIIDSGIDDDHPDLAPAVIQTCMPFPDNGVDIDGHGTAVAGVAAAVNNSIQIIGVAHGVSLWSSKDGNTVPSPDRTACGVQFGRVNGVHAINISTGYSNSHTALTDQINGAYYQDNIVVVVSAGNTGGGAVTYPATLDAAIAVSATDTNNAFGSFSSQGTKVEITAPGTTVTNVRGLISTCLGGTSSSNCGFMVQGTSFSAPHVAAAAAVLKTYNSSWTAAEIRGRLTTTATDLGPAGRDNQFGYGLLNVFAAIGAPPPPAPTVTISGPTTVKPNDTCLWQASVTGSPPFSYYWTKDGGFIGSASEVTTSFGQSGTLSVQVWDAYGTASDSKSITVSASARSCTF